MPQEQIEEYMRSGHGSLRGVKSSEPGLGVDDAEDDPDEPVDMEAFQQWLADAVGKPGEFEKAVEEAAAAGALVAPVLCGRCQKDPCHLHGFSEVICLRGQVPANARKVSVRGLPTCANASQRGGLGLFGRPAPRSLLLFNKISVPASFYTALAIWILSVCFCTRKV